MKVAELQAFVRGLAAPLTAAGAKQAAVDLERAAVGLEPFRDLTIAQWADFLSQAENYARTGVLSSARRSRRAAPVTDRSRVKAAAQQVLALSERAIAQDLPYTVIDAEIKKLDKLTKDEVLDLAREAGITASLKTKKAALAEIHRRITERKESHQRTQFRSPAPAATSSDAVGYSVPPAVPSPKLVT